MTYPFHEVVFLKNFGDIDSKFRYVIIASLRAKNLLKGAKPKIKTRAKNLIRVAQKEVQDGLIEYELITLPNDDIREVENDSFIGEEIKDLDKEPEPEDIREVKAKKEAKKAAAPKKKAASKPKLKAKKTKKDT